ncbi:nucleosome assembly protein 1-like 4 [Wyeomyia smithii]|uniref:nucleosome assembly protein 1-like 4 n=1 Tax=Wyeomyia smithii TaxID=174621 RepID=UPI002467E728|nr:nucleosome assembly protein 1-like 4 [Wyeomyia smithii]
MEMAAIKSFNDREEQLLRQISSLDIRIEQMKKMATLPTNVRVKVEALKKNQLELLQIEADYHRKVFAVEQHFQPMYNELYEKRRQLVTGAYVPSEMELAAAPDDAADQSKGIPEFWLTVFRMTPVLQSMIRAVDEEPLKRLVDVRVVINDEPQPGFDLVFEFEPNEFFNDRILKKKYMMRCAPNTDKPATFNGYEIFDTIGQTIDWKDGKDLTKLTMTEESGLKREVPTNSFFNFFDPKKLFESEPLLSITLLETDFEIGYYIKEQVVPRAVFLFTGEAEDELESDETSSRDGSLCGACKLSAHSENEAQENEDSNNVM